ncbi:hypothetical protein [Paenibacillus ginsengihumi]|uniref:hypothetical protein n=1 Tax=Paenibacillus ginsengihumi TaxID=431596 RepID=UPI00037AE126|nr:hypothetical protein [Paenibacillus ginsengihumi]
MSFMDEKITRFIIEAEQAMTPRSISEGPVKIGKRYYDFQVHSFYENKLTVYLPVDFEEMPKEARAIKYPHEQRPEIIRSDAAGSINFTFKRIDHELEDEWVEELTAGMRTMIAKSNPSHVFYETGIKQARDGKPVGFFEFKSMVLDGSLFNMMFFLEMGGEVLMGTFCCPYTDYPDWRDIAYQVIENIAVVQDPNGQEGE